MSHLQANKLEKSYSGRQVVKSMDIDLHSGEIVGLLGPNGAGKTTTFYMITGLVNPDQGTIKFDDQDITTESMSSRARTGIGYLPQEPSVFRRLSVEKNLMAILQLRKDLDKSAQKALCEDLLQEFNVAHLRNTLGISLSGGERRRVEIARALTRNPKFILLDEPFAGIDPISIIDIKRVITQLKDRGIGVLITDHNVRETLDICQRAYIVSDGQVIANGPPADLLENEAVRQVYLGEDFSI